MTLHSTDSLAAPIAVGKNGQLRILEFHGAEAVSETVDDVAGQLDKVLAEQKPDLVLLSGDNTRGISDTGTLRLVLKKLLTPILSRKLPWVVIFGDADRRDGGLSNAEQFDVYREFDGCLTLKGDEKLSGVGNFALPIASADGEPEALLWFMDSGCECTDYEKDFGSKTRSRLASPLYTEFYNDGVRFNQTMWYWHLSRALEKGLGHKLPGLMFFHIPTIEHTLIPMNAAITGMKGWQKEQVSCSQVCGGIFSAVMERGDIQGIYCGHSHRNNNHFVGTYCGVRLGLSRDFKADSPVYRVFDYCAGQFTEMSD